MVLARESAPPRRGGKLTPVRKLRKRVVVREVMKLSRPFGDVFLQLGLMRAQFRFRGDYLICHRVDRFREGVDFSSAAAWRASAPVAGRQLSCCQRESTDRPRNAHHQCERHHEYDAEDREPRLSQHAFRFLGGTRGVLCGDQQAAASGCLQFALSADDQCGAIVQEVAPCRAVGGVELLDLGSQLDGVSEIFTKQVHPHTAGGFLQLAQISCEDSGELLLFARTGTLRSRACAKRRGGGGQFGERATREHLILIDADTAATRGDHALLNAGECDVTASNPVRTLCSFFRKRLAARDVRGHVYLQLGDRWRDVRGRLAAEVRRQRVVQCVARVRDSGFVRIARCLHVLGHGPIESDELLDDGAGASGQRLVIVLHGANGFDRFASRLCCDRVAQQNDGDDGSEAERESSADAEFQASRTRDGINRLYGVFWHKT